MRFNHEELEKDYVFCQKLLARKTKKPQILATIFDSTLLKHNASRDEIEQLCQEAVKFQFRSVCIPPCYVDFAAHLLQGSTVRVCSVASFPFGYSTTETKLNEIKDLVKRPVDEIDFVQNITFVKSGNFSSLKKEFQEIFAESKKKLMKVILETSLLTDDEIYKCSYLAAQCGFAVIKTSSGFANRGASLHDIKIIKSALDKYQSEAGFFVGIKASGGVQTSDAALAFLRSGVTRIGSSRCATIINQEFSDSQEG